MKLLLENWKKYITEEEQEEDEEISQFDKVYNMINNWSPISALQAREFVKILNFDVKEILKKLVSENFENPADQDHKLVSHGLYPFTTGEIADMSSPIPRYLVNKMHELINAEGTEVLIKIWSESNSGKPGKKLSAEDLFGSIVRTRRYDGKYVYRVEHEGGINPRALRVGKMPTYDASAAEALIIDILQQRDNEIASKEHEIVQLWSSERPSKFPDSFPTRKDALKAFNNWEEPIDFFKLKKLVSIHSWRPLGIDSLVEIDRELRRMQGDDGYSPLDISMLYEVRPVGEPPGPIMTAWRYTLYNNSQPIQERCQKGYKTHPTRKTKIMFGKRYRNCVKAEESRTATADHKMQRYLKDRPYMEPDGMQEDKDPEKGTGKKPKGSGRRLYTDENPKDTVSVEFSSVAAIKRTLSKASFKAKSHKRQSQIINLIHQRVRAAYNNAKDPKVKKRLKSALDYAEKRKEASKKKTIRLRKAKK